ncbi:MAG: PIG-L deacetylase family protein [Caulobacterales bacterium]
MTPGFGRRILVLAAHPDDEVVACAAAIGRARDAGAQVFVLFLTHGCTPRDQAWPWRRGSHASAVARRRAEAERAARALGVTVVALADRPARTLWREMAAARDEVGAAIAAHAVDQLWAPAYEGGNPDHDALNAVAGSLRGAVSGGVLEFAEYNFAGGRARSHAFPSPNGGEQVIALTPAEQAQKRTLLRLYASEAGNLGYVGLDRECWRPLAAYDYARPPHAGRLWWARFQWVPFRHPQVDFTDPREVASAIAGFASEQYHSAKTAVFTIP